MKEHADRKIREINFNYLLASLIVLMVALPVLYEYTPVDYPELLEMVFVAALILGVLSLTGDMREFLAGLAVALSALVCAAVSVFLGSGPVPPPHDGCCAGVFSTGDRLFRSTGVYGGSC